MDMARSCQGTVTSIRMGFPDSGDLVGCGYFIGSRFGISADVPRERLKLITVGGKLALAELPISDYFVSPSRVVAIERFPSDAGPGIAVWARTINDLDRAIALVEQIMGGQ